MVDGSLVSHCRVWLISFRSVCRLEAVKRFLKENKLTSIIRAHEAQVDGYKMQMVNKQSGIPRVITIFSAPNYCDVCNADCVIPLISCCDRVYADQSHLCRFTRTRPRA